MTAAPQISRRDLSQQLETHLKELGFTVYVGEVPDAVPVQVDLTGARDPDGRVAPYLVIYTSPGTPDIEPDLGDSAVDLLWKFQVTVAAGYHQDCEHALDQVVPHLHRWTPNLPSHLAAGGCRPDPGFEPGPIRIDRDPVPPRFWAPLLMQLPVTT